MTKIRFSRRLTLPALAVCCLVSSPQAWARHKAETKIAPPVAPIGSPALRLVQAYQLGISDYAPAAAVERLDATIKTSHLSVPEMSTAAKQTRADEQAGYNAALQQLKLMGAPAPVTAPYSSNIAILSAPVSISDRAKYQLPSDPTGQIIWSTLDEAERLAPSGGGTLIPWLKLSRGGYALWAYHLGNLTSVIRAGIPGDPSYFPLIHGAGALAESAPPGCPTALIDSLRALAGRANENNVTTASLAALDASIQAVFDPSPTEQPAPATTKIKAK